MDDRADERTETEERVAENRQGVTALPADRRTQGADPATGLVPGQNEDKRSLLDGVIEDK